MLARNREFARAVLVWLILTGIAATCALWCGRVDTALGIAVGSALAALPFLCLTVWRYRELRRLASRLDAVLAGERELAFSQMEEGELAVLASELDKMVARLTRTAEDLARERQSLADALADISHQLKTPLTSLALTTELVRKELARHGDAPELVERLRRIEALEMRVEELVSVLLRLARLDAGALDFAQATVSVDELVERAASPLAIAYDLADVALGTELEPGASFTGDLAWTAEALGNVLKNCLEHTPAGGHVTVRAVEDILACRISVEDTGPGIAEEDLPHIFERFYRGGRGAGENGASSEVNPAGVGIGLSLARALVSAQGGTLTAENARDDAGRVTGARFTFTFFKDLAV